MTLSGWEILRHSKNAAAVVGVTGVLYSAYAVSGLPVPATVYQVDQRIESVRSSIHTVNLDVIETQRAVLALRKSALRTEKFLLSKAPETEQWAKRVGEIDDEIADISKKEDVLLMKMQALRLGVRAPTT